jgi:hypothetical protein
MMSFNLPKRQATGKPPSTQSDPRPTSGLLKALMETGRTKGSSATPAPPVISPNPNRDFQAQLDKMNSASHAQQNQIQDMGPADARYGPSSQRPGATHNRNMSSVTQQSFQTGGYTSRNPTPGAGPSHFRPDEDRGSGQGNNQVKSTVPIRFSFANILKANDGCQAWSKYLRWAECSHRKNPKLQWHEPCCPNPLDQRDPPT